MAPPEASAAATRAPSNSARTRSGFSSAWGTVFAMAGVAIGLGNVWRFPYMMGKYGGLSFLLLYLFIVVAFGIPALMAEWALGRHTRLGPWRSFERAGMHGGRWWSYLLLITVLTAGSYYGVVLAWVLYYTVAFSARGVGLAWPLDFAGLTGTAAIQMLFAAITTGLGCAALYLGVKRGIESLSRLILPLFFGLFVILLVRVVTLPGAWAALRTLLQPRWLDVTATTPVAAVGQAFFSLGLGGTFMVVYGSYMREEEDIPRGAAWTAVADTAAALLAAMIVVPAALVFDVPLSSGPPLMFEVMPRVFEQIPSGSLFAALFFASVFLVALLSLMAAYEVVVAACQDALGWARGSALTIVFVVELLLAIPATLSVTYIEYSDLLCGSTMQPVGGVVALVAVTWCLGRTRTLDEIRRNARLPIPVWLFYWVKFGIPVAILAVLGYGWASRLLGSPP